MELVVASDIINAFYASGSLPLDTLPPIYPNELVRLSSYDGTQTALVTNYKGSLTLVKPGILSTIQPKNKEQVFLSWALSQEIPMTIAIGKAGSGKTLISLAAAVRQVIQEKKFDKLILTKPMETVGRIQLGALPGNVKEKFDPYGASFIMQLQEILGKYSKEQVEIMFDKGMIEYIPIQIMRGMSFKNAFVIADEVQSLDRHEMLTLCSRIGQGSKLILLGDINQRDRKIEKVDTGLYQLLHSDKILQSPLVAQIELIKNERSPLVDLITDVLQE